MPIKSGFRFESYGIDTLALDRDLLQQAENATPDQIIEKQPNTNNNLGVGVRGNILS